MQDQDKSPIPQFDVSIIAQQLESYVQLCASMEKLAKGYAEFTSKLTENAAQSLLVLSGVTSLQQFQDVYSKRVQYSYDRFLIEQKKLRDLIEKITADNMASAAKATDFVTKKTFGSAKQAKEKKTVRSAEAKLVS